MRRLGLILLPFLLIACLEDLVLEGDGYLINTEPRLGSREIVDPGAALVISEGGAQVLAENFDPIVRAFLGLPDEGPLDFSSIVAEVLANDPRVLGDFMLADVRLTVDLPNPQGILVEFVGNPVRLRVSVSEVWLDIQATGIQPVAPGSFACRVQGKIDQGTADERMVTLTDVVVEVEVGAQDGRFDIEVSDLSFVIAESGVDVITDRNDPDYYCNFPECSDGLSGCSECHAICGGAGILEDVGNYLAQYLDGVLAAVLDVLADEFVGGFEHLSGELHPANFFGAYAPDLVDSHRLEFGARPSKNGIQVLGQADSRALAAEVALGLRAKQAHPCVGEDLGMPRFQAGSPPQSAAVGGDLSIGAPAAILNQLMWSAYRAGALCLQVSSDDITKVSRLAGGDLRLTAGTLSLLLPGLDQVVGRDTPLMISVSPRFELGSPELVTLGTGLPLEAGDGSAVDSLMKFELPPVEIGIHAWVEGRWLRLFAIEAAPEVGITPSLRVDGGIDLTIDELAVSGVRETYNELFGEVNLEQLFDAVFDLALGLLSGGGIALPLDLETLLGQVLGVPLSVNLTGIRSAGGGGDWLLISAELSGVRQASPLVVGAVGPEVVEMEPGHSIAIVLEAHGPGGKVPDGRVQFRVDGGAWRRWRPAGEVLVESPWLLVPGRHVVEVRARRGELWRTTGLVPARVFVEVRQAQVREDPVPVASRGAGCAAAAGTPLAPWWWLVSLVVVLVIGRRTRCGPRPEARVVARSVRLGLVLMVLAIGGGVACDDETRLAEVITCQGAIDCPAGQVCGCAGVCYAPEACADSSDCCAGTTCVEGRCTETRECAGSGDCGAGEFCGGCLCRLARCDGDAGCDEGERCVASACTPGGTFPCPARCGEQEVCLGELRRCVPRPALCGDLVCGPGEAIVVDRADDVLGPLCSYESAGCHCETLSVSVVSGDPSAYIGVVPLPSGEFLVGAYDLAMRDVTVRLLDPGTQELGEIQWIEGFPEAQGPLPESQRGAYGPGPDVGAELAMAVDSEGYVAMVYRDRTAGTVRFIVGDGVGWLGGFDLDDGGRWPHVEPDPLGGWVVAYQQVQTAAGAPEGQFRTSLRIAASGVRVPESWADFGYETVESETVDIAYLDLPAGQGATPSLAHAEGRWYVVWHDGVRGTLAMGTWTQLPFIDTAVVVEPASRGDVAGAATGVAPKLIAGPGGRLDALFLDATSGELRHARWRWTGAVSDLHVQVVDPGRSGSPQREIGLDATFVLSPSGQMVAAWQDATFGDLWLGQAQGDPAQWETRVWSSQGSTGFFPRIVHPGGGGSPLLVYGRWTFPGVRAVHQELVVQVYSE